MAPCGLQPGPLAFSCMAMTLHTGEALALIHSHANSFVITNDFWYVSVLVGNGNESFAGVLQTFLEVLYASMSAEQALADLGTSPSQWIAATFSCSVDLAKMCGHARLIAAPHSRQRFPVWLQRFPHRLENNRCRRAVQHGEAASGSTMKKPWPKPVDDSQKARIPASSFPRDSRA